MGIGSEVGVSSGAFIFDTGQDTQASFITPLGEDGTINVNTWAATDLAIDVIGYFTAPTRTYHYSYDTTGLRASKSLDDNGAAGAGWSREFTWDTSGGLPLLLAEHRGSRTMDDLRSFMNWARAGLGQIIGRVTTRIAPRLGRGLNVAGLVAVLYHLVRALWVTGDPDPVGSWDAQPPSANQSPEGIPLWPATK